MTDEISKLLRFGEDSVTEFKSLSIPGHRVAAPATDDTADEIAAAANAAGAAFIFGINDKTREIEGVKAEKSVNAVAHRDYSISGAKIRLHMFSDRLEIFSPGGLPNSMTLDEIGERQFARNELICTCLSRCKLTTTIENIRRTRIMDRRGEGVPVILAASQELSGKRPEYKLLNESEVLLIVRASPLDDRSELRRLVQQERKAGARSGRGRGAVEAQSKPVRGSVGAQSKPVRGSVGAQSERSRGAVGAQSERSRGAVGAQSGRSRGAVAS